MDRKQALAWIKLNLGRKIKTPQGKVYVLKLDARLPPHDYVTAALCDPATRKPLAYAGISWIAENCKTCTARDTVSIHVVPKPAERKKESDHEGEGSQGPLAQEVR